MSAECELHGVDLHGSPWSEGGFTCPVCEREARISELEEALREARTFLEWLLLMDDPSSPMGVATRQRVTLTQIIGKADATLAAIKKAAPPPSSTEPRDTKGAE